MVSLASVELDGDLVAAAQERADQEGRKLTDFLSDIVRRALERGIEDDSLLVYDHAAAGPLVLDRLDDETEAGHRRRSDLYDRVFQRP